MAKHYLQDTIEEEQFRLWAIHSSLADYQIAFLLNKFGQTQLKRNIEPILWGVDAIAFEHFSWEEPSAGIQVSLVSNRSEIAIKKNLTYPALFDLPQTKEVYLARQMKQVDFFILQYNPAPFFDFSVSLQNVPGIEMVYEIEPTKQPTELNLIRN